MIIQTGLSANRQMFFNQVKCEFIRMNTKHKPILFEYYVEVADKVSWHYDQLQIILESVGQESYFN